MVKFPSAMDYVPEGLHGSLGFDWIEAVEDQCVAWSWIESNISRGEKKKNTTHERNPVSMGDLC